MVSRDPVDIFKLSTALLGPCSVDTSVPSWRAAEMEGWDMSLVMDSLSKPVARRMHEHGMALAQAESLKTTIDRKHVAS